MAAPRKYPEELRERAIRMALDLRRDPATGLGHCAEQVSSSGSIPRHFATGSSRPRSTTATG
jgi:transposase